MICSVPLQKFYTFVNASLTYYPSSPPKSDLGPTTRHVVYKAGDCSTGRLVDVLPTSIAASLAPTVSSAITDVISKGTFAILSPLYGLKDGFPRILSAQESDHDGCGALNSQYTAAPKLLWCSESAK
ncbi:hypothetical protein CDAR_207441 [Caerostris darwini]|uniref:Uncharacterized protein n=1 Tax=Caerostris darwini TaxID=1538125 RepID=A0AAV4VHM9_9ARAC|nr:hypothetical protein CDAR_207441 [Caerostris darwini]